MKINLIIRGWRNSIPVLSERLVLEHSKDLESIIPNLVEKHVAILGDGRSLIEIEFLDEPDPNERFFRFGTDPDGMIWPVALEL